MFEVDVAGLAQIEGGKPAFRLALEPVANVFDEFRGYGDERRSPSYCAVTLEHSANPRGVWLTVADDGAGFENERDVWTLFGQTGKRNYATVSGRFNAGDKQLIAAARSAEIQTGHVVVSFVGGERHVARRRARFCGTIVRALMPWSKADMDDVRNQLLAVVPPNGLRYTVDNRAAEFEIDHKYRTVVSVPTVLLVDNVLRQTARKTPVAVISRHNDRPVLYELGLPICSLDDVGFPWSLDVGQKIPVPLSRDSVSTAYVFQLIGKVLESAAMDGVKLLTPDQENAGFVKRALDWVRKPEALQKTVASIYGDNAARVSNDSVANAQHAATGGALISGRQFAPATRRRLDDVGVVPTTTAIHGGSVGSTKEHEGTRSCPTCGGRGRIEK